LYSFEQIFDYIELILGLLFAVYITKMVYFEHDYYIFKKIYDIIPLNVKTAFKGRDILVYLMHVPIVLMIFILIVRPLKILIFKFLLEPITEGLYRILKPLGNKMKFILGALVQIPKAVFIVLIAALLLNFSAYYFSAPKLSKWMNESTAYNLLNEKALNPILNSSIAKKIPVLLNDSFKLSEGELQDGAGGNSIVDRLAKNITGRNVSVVEYFNGVTLDEAIKTSPEIDSMAKQLVKGEIDDYKKARILYKWIAKNLKYDQNKAQKVSANPEGISSGSIVAFNTRKGICFDYSCLYISMCRAVGLKVRLITGLGFSGVSWGDHAWNQVYSSSKGAWINVDTTFCTIANYFDSSNFNVDHKYAQIQGEW